MGLRPSCCKWGLSISLLGKSDIYGIWSLFGYIWEVIKGEWLLLINIYEYYILIIYELLFIETTTHCWIEFSTQIVKHGLETSE